MITHHETPVNEAHSLVDTDRTVIHNLTHSNNNKARVTIQEAESASKSDPEKNRLKKRKPTAFVSKGKQTQGTDKESEDSEESVSEEDDDDRRNMPKRVVLQDALVPQKEASERLKTRKPTSFVRQKAKNVEEEDNEEEVEKEEKENPKGKMVSMAPDVVDSDSVIPARLKQRKVTAFIKETPILDDEDNEEEESSDIADSSHIDKGGKETRKVVRLEEAEETREGRPAVESSRIRNRKATSYTKASVKELVHFAPDELTPPDNEEPSSQTVGVRIKARKATAFVKGAVVLEDGSDDEEREEAEVQSMKSVTIKDDEKETHDPSIRLRTRKLTSFVRPSDMGKSEEELNLEQDDAEEVLQQEIEFSDVEAEEEDERERNEQMKSKGQKKSVRLDETAAVQNSSVSTRVKTRKPTAFVKGSNVLLLNEDSDSIENEEKEKSKNGRIVTIAERGEAKTHQDEATSIRIKNRKPTTFIKKGKSEVKEKQELEENSEDEEQESNIENDPHKMKAEGEKSVTIEEPCFTPNKGASSRLKGRKATSFVKPSKKVESETSEEEAECKASSSGKVVTINDTHTNEKRATSERLKLRKPTTFVRDDRDTEYVYSREDTMEQRKASTDFVEIGVSIKDSTASQEAHEKLEDSGNPNSRLTVTTSKCVRMSEQVDGSPVSQSVSNRVKNRKPTSFVRSKNSTGAGCDFDSSYCVEENYSPLILSDVSNSMEILADVPSPIGSDISPENYPKSVLKRIVDCRCHIETSFLLEVADDYLCIYSLPQYIEVESIALSRVKLIIHVICPNPLFKRCLFIYLADTNDVLVIEETMLHDDCFSHMMRILENRAKENQTTYMNYEIGDLEDLTQFDLMGCSTSNCSLPKGKNYIFFRHRNQPSLDKEECRASDSTDRSLSDSLKKARRSPSTPGVNENKVDDAIEGKKKGKSDWDVLNIKTSAFTNFLREFKFRPPKKTRESSSPGAFGEKVETKDASGPFCPPLSQEKKK